MLKPLCRQSGKSFYDFYGTPKNAPITENNKKENDPLETVRNVFNKSEIIVPLRDNGRSRHKELLNVDDYLYDD